MFTAKQTEIEDLMTEAMNLLGNSLYSAQPGMAFLTKKGVGRNYRLLSRMSSPPTVVDRGFPPNLLDPRCDGPMLGLVTKSLGSPGFILTLSWVHIDGKTDAVLNVKNGAVIYAYRGRSIAHACARALNDQKRRKKVADDA